MSRVTLVPFLALYSAFDASVGLSGGLLTRYVSGHPNHSKEVSQAADTVTDPLSALVLAVVYLVRRVVLAGRRDRRGGHDTVVGAGSAVLVIGAAIFAIDHAARFGPTGMVLWLIGAVMIDRRQARGHVGIKPCWRLASCGSTALTMITFVITLRDGEDVTLISIGTLLWRTGRRRTTSRSRPLRSGDLRTCCETAGL